MANGSLSDRETVELLCDEIACGNGIAEAAEIAGVHESTVYKKMARDPVFSSRIARAREAQQDAIAEQIVRMADAATTENHQVVKLRIWARQWRASKLAPKKYGDIKTVDTNANVTVTTTRELDISTLTDEQLDALEGALRATVAQLSAPAGPVIEHED